MCNFDSSFEMGQRRESDKTARTVRMPVKKGCCNQSLSNCQRSGRARNNKSATCSHLPSTAFIMRFPAQQRIQLPPKSSDMGSRETYQLSNAGIVHHHHWIAG